MTRRRAVSRFLVPEEKLLLNRSQINESARSLSTKFEERLKKNKKLLAFFYYI